MSLVSQVKQNIDCECIVQECQKGQCSLKLNNLPEHFLLIDMDHERAPMSSQNGKKCDYVFIGDGLNDLWVAPLELKGGKYSASQVIGQLQAGASVADHVVSRKAQTRFRPILAHRRGVHRAQQKRLKSTRIQFRSQKRLIKRVKCGSSLVDALTKA